MATKKAVEAVPNKLGAVQIDPSLSPEAQGVMREVLLTRPDLSGASLAILEQAIALVEMSVELDQVRKEHGLMSTTDRGAKTVAGWVTEARQCRQAAAQLLQRLGVADEGATSTYDKLSAAGRAGNAKRWGH